MNKVLAIFILVIGINSWASVCNKECEGKEEKIDLCLIEGSVSTGLQKVAGYANCGYWAERYVVNSETEVRSTLSNLAKSCKRVNNLVLEGHGSPGYHSIGIGLNSNVFDGYSCLMAQDSYVRMVGCNVASGCVGDMFMHGLAEDLFSKNKGRINAPTFYASTVVPGVIPMFSLNGRSRDLQYDPKKRPPSTWGLTGLAIGSGGTMADHCKSEITELIDDVNSARKRAERRRCEASTFHIGERKLSEYQTLANGLSDSQSWDYSNVRSAIRRLEYQLDSLKDCRPASRDNNQNNSSSATAIQ